MVDKELLKKEIRLSRNIMILTGSVWVASLVLFVSTISGFSGPAGMLTGNLVSGGGGAEAQLPSMPSIVSAVIYFVGLIALGGAMFVISKHSQELRVMLKLEPKEREMTGSSRQVLSDFFSILSSWSIKNMPPDIVVAVLKTIKEAEKKSLPALSKVSFNLTKENEIQVEVDTDPGMDEVIGIFGIYLTRLGVDREKMLNIADYLGKNDVGAILCRIGSAKTEKCEPAAGKPKKQGKAAPAQKRAAKPKQNKKQPKAKKRN